MAAEKQLLARKSAASWMERAQLLDGEQHLVIDKPAPNVSRITINRPETNNLMTHRTRAQLFNQLQLNDQDPDVRVTIIHGAGGNFSAGHDFDTHRDEPLPFFEPEGEGQTARHVVNGWFMINDLGKPVIASVEGEALGGGMELAAACDVCIVAEDAQIGYPQVRGQGLPDYQIYPWLCGMRNAMEIMLLNRPMTGLEAMQKNFATECVPKAMLEERTLDFAIRVAKIPADLLAFNKRSVHRAFEAQGIRTNLRTAVDLESLMFKAAGAKMLTARRGPAARRAPGATPPRPGAGAGGAPASLPKPVGKPTGPSVGAMAVSASKPNPAVTPAKSLAKAAAAPTPVKASAPTPVKASAPTPVKAAAATTTTPKVVKATPPPVTATTPKATPPVTATPKPATATLKQPTVVSPKPLATNNTEETTSSGQVHLHLHDAIHIHIGGSKL